MNFKIPHVNSIVMLTRGLAGCDIYELEVAMYVGSLMSEIQRRWISYELTVGIFAILSICTHGLESIAGISLKRYKKLGALC
jgi:hypothetical protein